MVVTPAKWAESGCNVTLYITWPKSVYFFPCPPFCLSQTQTLCGRLAGAFVRAVLFGMFVLTWLWRNLPNIFIKFCFGVFVLVEYTENMQILRAPSALDLVARRTSEGGHFSGQNVLPDVRLVYGEKVVLRKCEPKHFRGCALCAYIKYADGDDQRARFVCMFGLATVWPGQHTLRNIRIVFTRLLRW